MNTKIALTSTDANDNEVTKIITDVNPAADGTALKTFAQALNNLTTNSYVGTTKINIDTLTDEDTSGNNPLPAPKIIIGVFPSAAAPTWVELPVANYKATWTGGTFANKCGVWLETESAGAVNAISAPPSSFAAVRETSKDWTSAWGPPAELTEGMTARNRWVLCFVTPDYDDPDCLGKFVYQIDATDTHSSVTITLNITNIIQ